MLNNNVIVDKQGPAWFPSRKVIFQMNPVDVPKFRSDLSEACFKASIVIAKEPNLLRVTCCISKLAETLLTNLQLILDGRAGLPTDWGVPGYSAAVDSVTIAYDRDWLERAAKEYHSFVSSGWRPGPIVSVTENDDTTISDS
jgi:lipopolysaccharide/colanic/teichoic acid biosynthesis glycosyltransferase